MYKLIVSKIMLSTLIFILVVALCACGSDMDVISQEPALEEEYEELASEGETSDIKDSFMEDAPQEETETPQGETEDKNDMQEIYKQVMAGDLTALSQMEDFERIESAYNNPNTLSYYEWKLVDIDHNGYEELVWQEKEDAGYRKRIVGLFSFEKEPKCIIWDLNDSTEFYFISDRGNLVYYDQYFGMYRFFSLDGYTLDENLDLDFTYGLRLYDIYDLSEIDENYLLEFQESNPDIVSEGIYYRKITSQDSKGGETKEILTEEQFVIEFAELMGTDFYEYYEKFS